MALLLQGLAGRVLTIPNSLSSQGLAGKILASNQLLTTQGLAGKILSTAQFIGTQGLAGKVNTLNPISLALKISQHFIEVEYDCSDSSHNALKVWDGTAWRHARPRVFNGTAFTAVNIRQYLEEKDWVTTSF